MGLLLMLLCRRLCNGRTCISENSIIRRLMCTLYKTKEKILSPMIRRAKREDNCLSYSDGLEKENGQEENSRGIKNKGQ